MISLIAKLMPYKWAITAGAVVLILSGIYVKGRADGKHAERARWEARMVAVQHKIDALEVESDSLAYYRQKAAAAEIAAAQSHTAALAGKIEAQKPALNVGGPMPKPAIDLYNEAVRGTK